MNLVSQGVALLSGMLLGALLFSLRRQSAVHFQSPLQQVVSSSQGTKLSAGHQPKSVSGSSSPGKLDAEGDDLVLPVEVASYIDWQPLNDSGQLTPEAELAFGLTSEQTSLLNEKISLLTQSLADAEANVASISSDDMDQFLFIPGLGAASIGFQEDLRRWLNEELGSPRGDALWSLTRKANGYWGLLAREISVSIGNEQGHIVEETELLPRGGRARHRSAFSQQKYLARWSSVIESAANRK